jgi:S1-C subfamily serine protease
VVRGPFIASIHLEFPTAGAIVRGVYRHEVPFDRFVPRLRSFDTCDHLCGPIQLGNRDASAQNIHYEKLGLLSQAVEKPDFTNVKGSGFFKDEKNFPGQEGLILTNAHAVSLAQSIKVSNGREKRRYEVKSVGICDSADFAVLKMEAAELADYQQRNGKVVPLDLGDSDKLRVGDKVLGWGTSGGERSASRNKGKSAESRSINTRIRRTSG